MRTIFRIHCVNHTTDMYTLISHCVSVRRARHRVRDHRDATKRLESRKSFWLEEVPAPLYVRGLVRLDACSQAIETCLACKSPDEALYIAGSRRESYPVGVGETSTRLDTGSYTMVFGETTGAWLVWLAHSLLSNLGMFAGEELTELRCIGLIYRHQHQILENLEWLGR